MTSTIEQRMEDLHKRIVLERLWKAAPNPCHTPSGPKGGQFCSTSGGASVGIPLWQQTKRWRGMEVDAELRDGDLIRANKAANAIGSSVISVCSGHPKKESGIHAGASESPGFNLELMRESPKVVEAVASQLRGKDTRVETFTWGGEHGHIVTHVNGKVSPYVQSLPKAEQETVLSFNPNRAGIHVDSTIAHNGSNQAALHGWWDDTLQRLETVKKF